MQSMARLATTLAVIATGGLLASCASAGPRATRAATTTRTGSTPVSPASGRRLTKSQAIAFARAVNLRASDLPGFKASPRKHEPETAAEKRAEQDLARCVGGTGTRDSLAETNSAEFQRKASIAEQNVSSGVSVAQTSTAATRELDKIRSSHTRGCFSHFLDLLFKGTKYRRATVGPVSIAAGTPPAPGTAGSFGWRITVTMTVRSLRIPFYLDYLGFVYGSAEVTLLSSTTLLPFPAAAERSLFSLLLARAKGWGRSGLVPTSA